LSKLYVDEIQPKTTGGIITMPTTIAFDASRTSSGTGAEGWQGVITFNHVTTNIGNAYNSSNGRFTAPVAGTYEFTHMGMGSGNSGGGGLAANNSVQLYFRKNGSDTNTTRYGRVYAYSTATTYPNLSTSIILTLAQNDYIEVYYHAYFMYVEADHIWNNFTGKLIGASS